MYSTAISQCNDTIFDPKCLFAFLDLYISDCNWDGPSLALLVLIEKRRSTDHVELPAMPRPAGDAYVSMEVYKGSLAARWPVLALSSLMVRPAAVGAAAALSLFLTRRLRAGRHCSCGRPAPLRSAALR